jgi:chromosome partitioning protein
LILAVGNVKGGVGKTTLAINLSIALARAKRDILLIDGDEQGTALAFTDLRTNQREGPPGYTAVALHGANLRTQARQLSRKYSDIVIECWRPQYGQPAGRTDGRRGRGYSGKAAKLRLMGCRPDR